MNVLYSLSFIGFRNEKRQARETDRDRQRKGQRFTSLYQNN